MSEKITTIQNDRMAQFIAIINRKVSEALENRASDMLESWHANISEANDNETPCPPLKIGITATVDLSKGEIVTQLSFATKHVTKITAKLPDPNQLDLPLNPAQKAAAAFVETCKKHGGSVEITAGNTGVRIADGKVTPIKTAKKKGK